MESGKRGWLFLTAWRDSQTPKIKHLHRNGMWLIDVTSFYGVIWNGFVGAPF